MTNLIPVDSEWMDQMEKVTTLTMQGHAPGTIAKQLGIKRAVVLEIIDHWKFGLANDEDAKDRAREALRQMDKHFDLLIQKYWDTFNQVEQEITTSNVTAPMVAQKLTALKGVSEIETKRLDALQKAGLLDNESIADEVAEVERKQAILMDILRNDLCEKCRPEVKRRLQQVTQQVEVIQVVDDVVQGEVVED